MAIGDTSARQCQADSERRALIPGSYDPFTIGHKSIVDRALSMFDHVVIACGISLAKHSADEIAERLKPIRQLYRDDSRVSVISYDGLTVDAAADHGCSVIVRGLRNAIDLEYERPMAEVNRQLSGIETIFLIALPEYQSVSSSLVRELRHYGRDVANLLP